MKSDSTEILIAPETDIDDMAVSEIASWSPSCIGSDLHHVTTDFSALWGWR